MFDEQVKHAYQKITPSFELEQKILNMHPIVKKSQAKVLILRRIATIAACMVLLLSGVALIRPDSVEVLMTDGTVLSEHAISVDPQYFGPVVARTLPDPAIASYSLDEDATAQIAVPLVFSARKKLSISVESGSLLISYNDDNTEEYVEAGQNAVGLDGDTALYWILPMSDEDAVYDMTINGKHIVRVMFDAKQQKYTISHMIGNS